MRNLTTYEIHDIINKDFINKKDIFSNMYTFNIKIKETSDTDEIIIFDNYEIYFNITPLRSLLIFESTDNYAMLIYCYLVFAYYCGYNICEYNISLSNIDIDLINSIIFEYILPKKDVLNIFNELLYDSYKNIGPYLYKIKIEYNDLFNTNNINKDLYNIIKTIYELLEDIVHDLTTNISLKFVRMRLMELSNV